MKGIYKFEVEGKIYIGQSINITARYDQHLNAIDNSEFHLALKRNNYKFKFEILESGDFDKSTLDSLEKKYIQDYKSDKLGWNRTAGNGTIIKRTGKNKMQKVPPELDKYFYTKHLNAIRNKNILFIGEFPCIPVVAYYNKVIVWTNEIESNYGDEIIVQRLYEQEDYINMSKNLEKDKFDIIIANPPYQIANKVIKNCIDKTKEAIVLMPVKNYKAQELYKHVLELEVVDPKVFKEVSVQDNLTIAKLTNKKIEQDYMSLYLETVDPQYKNFYLLNFSLKHKVIDSFSESWLYSKISEPKYPNYFLITIFDSNGDYGSENSPGFKWNITKSLKVEDIKIKDRDKQGNPFTLQGGFLVFNTEKECSNFKRFWYGNPLRCELIKGLNIKRSNPKLAFPKIDWSKDRDYEHLKLEELMQIMKEDNNIK